LELREGRRKQNRQNYPKYGYQLLKKELEYGTKNELFGPPKLNNND